MSILVKGLQMPKDCEACPFWEGLVNGCPIAHYFTIRRKGVDRPEWCPLIPVPDHGDLIEKEYAIGSACSGRIRALPTTEDGEDWIRVEEVRQSIKSAPVVIPAERSEDGET